MLQKLFSKSVYTKGVFTLLKGTFIAQFIGFFCSIWIAKLYGTTEFGVFSKFLSISAVFTIFLTLRLESALVLSKKEQENSSIITAVFYNIFIVGCLSVLLLFFTPENYISSLNLTKFILFSALSLGILKAIESIYILHLNRVKEFSKIANSKVIFTILRYGFQVLLFFQLEKSGLIIGFLIASFLVCILLFILSKVQFASVSFNRYKSIIKENKNLVVFGTLSDNLNTVNINFIPIVFGFYFANEQIGKYFLAVTLLSIPPTFISNSYAKVFFLKTSELYNNHIENLYNFIKNSTLKLTFITLLFFVVAFLLSDVFISTFFGEEWSKTSLYIKILIPLFFLRAVYNPLSNLEEVFKKNHIGLLFNCYLIIVNIVSLYYGFTSKNFTSALILISVTNSLGYILISSYFFKYSKKLSLKKPQ